MLGPLADRHTLGLCCLAAGSAAGALWLLRRAVAGTPSSSAAGGGTAAVAATSFEAYLKDARVGRQEPAKPAYAPTSFEAYLRQPAAATAAADAAADGAAVSSAAAAADAAPPTARPLTVLFGTEYGFSREAAERACGALREAGYWPRLLDMADLPQGLPSLGAAASSDGESGPPHQALLLVCSTQGDGVPPTEAREFCDWLHGSGAPQLGGLPFAVCALGDRSYQHFCRCGRSLDERLEALGGARLAPRVDVNREDWAAIDGWVQAVLAGLAPLPLRAVAELGGAAALSSGGGDASSGGAAPAPKRWGKARPYLGTVVAVEALCALASAEDKDTVRVELDLGDSGLSYAPGDALGVWPSNDPQAVDALLAELGADGQLLVQLPSWHYADPTLPPGTTSLPLRAALERCYDLRQPKPELLSLLRGKLSEAAAAAAAAAKGWPQQQAQAPADASAAVTVSVRGGGGGTDGEAVASKVRHARAQDSASEMPGGHSSPQLCDQRCLADKLERLAALAADAAAAEAYLAPRHVIDVLRDFGPPTAASAGRLGAAELLGALRQLQPRLYSISSSQLEHPTRVQATVAVVRYSSLGAARAGVCSAHLGERLAAGGRVPVYIHRNPDFRLPADASTPIIMVGPGTGLAPFRSFMQERLLAAAAAAQQEVGTPLPSSPLLGQCVLFFGCRRRNQDFLYGPLLEGWAAGGALTLFTAFSREQGHKVYVQDRLVQQAPLVWRLLHEEGAHFYVCGDAGAMAAAVESALLRIIAGGLTSGLEGGPESGGPGSGAGSDAAAAEYLQRLSKEGRYQRDVWLS